MRANEKQPEEKHQAPSPKHQRSSKSQAPNRRGWMLRLGASLDVGAWSLVLFLVSGCTPAGPRALLSGKHLVEQGKYPQAITKLKTATSLLPTNAQAWNYLGLAYHYAGQSSEAEGAYQRALTLDRDLSETHYNLGLLYLAQNKLDP